MRAEFAKHATLWLCLLLLALLSIAQVAHTHKDASDADHCTICMVLQNVTPAATISIAVLLVAIERTVLCTFAPARITRPAIALFCRPPPAFLG